MAARRVSDADVVVLGGGIVGCAVAAMAASRGARVVLVEGTAIGAGASGRNLGAVQHPFDPVLAPLYEESLLRYAALAETVGPAFSFRRRPAGLLLLHRDAADALAQVERLAADVPSLVPRFVSPEELPALEPSLRRGPAAVRLETGYPIPPASATEAWAALAAHRGATILLGRRGRPHVDRDRVTGAILADGSTISADRVLVAAGPWTPELVDPDGAWQPIRSTYGVTVALRLGAAAPRHIVEEDAVDGVNRAAAATDLAAATDADRDPPSLFSLASAGGISTLGSTFLPSEPDPASVEALLLRRATRFVPAVAEAEIVGRRMCARPQSVDGRPFVGAIPGVRGLHVCAGHGPWGISTGPASAAIATRAILDGTDPPAPLAASRPV